MNYNKLHFKQLCGVFQVFTVVSLNVFHFNLLLGFCDLPFLHTILMLCYKINQLSLQEDVHFKQKIVATM